MNKRNYFRVLLTAALFILGGAFLASEPVKAADKPVSVTECTVNKKGTKISVKAAEKSKPKGMWKYYYLFSTSAYKTPDTIYSGTPLGTATVKKKKMTFTVTYKPSYLVREFVIAYKSSGGYKVASDPFFLDNPETLASYTKKSKPASKKGLQATDFKTVAAKEEPIALRCSHVLLNLDINSFVLPSTMKGATVYKYDGKKYYFDSATIARYDSLIGFYTANNIEVTAVLLLKPTTDNTIARDMCYPGIAINPAVQQYSSINTSTKKGCLAWEAFMSYMAEHYGTAEHLISNWIIGNEINNPSGTSPQLWNYAGGKNLDDYMQDYSTAYRICNNAVRGTNKYAKTYLSLDYYWNYDGDGLGNNMFAGKAVLNKFYEKLSAAGKLDIHVAYHAYPYGLFDPVFWDDDAKAYQSENAPVVNLNNLSVLTDYIKKNFGKNNSVMLSEQSFNSTKGEMVQAAAFAYGYYICEGNPMVDAFLYGRQYDNAAEEGGVAWGLSDAARNRRTIWKVFQCIDSSESFKYTEKLLPYTNRSSWTSISGVKKSIFSKMPSVKDGRLLKTDLLLFTNPPDIPEDSVNLSWNPVAGCDGYVIYRNNKKIGTTTGRDSNVYMDSNLTSGATYTYKVCGYSNIYKTNLKDCYQVIGEKASGKYKPSFDEDE